ncbi:ArsR/SmtB family transcription factor [Kribbella sancticallisti]
MYHSSRAADPAAMLEVGRALSCENRLTVLVALLEGPSTVGTLVRHTGTSQPNVSNHLAVLRTSGLVTAEKVGRTVQYRLTSSEVASLVRALIAVTS